MITIHLTEAQAARIYYAMQREASEYSQQINNIRRNGGLSASSGRNELIAERGRDECLAISRMLEVE